MRKHVFGALALIALVAIAVLAYLAWPDRARLDVAAVSGDRPAITAPREEVLPTIKIARAVGWRAGEQPVAAPGLAVQRFAEGLDHPRWIYRLPNGDVLVAESNSPPREGGGITGWVMKRLMRQAGAGKTSANRITLLRDVNGDGVAEQRSPFLSNLNSPLGMVLLNGFLYIANTDALVRVPYADGQTRITTPPEVVVRYPGGGNHWARNVIAAEDGRTLYVAVGSASNVAENGLERERNRAAILQVDPDRRTFRIFAAGLRNPQGMALNPDTRQLWTVVNERDMLGSDLVPDYLTQVSLGDHFGWPWYYWGGYVDPRVEPRNPQLQQYSKRPDYALGPHVAALGLTFADGIRLGNRFARGTFIGEHGSWNRRPASGYKVAFVPFTPQGWPVRGSRPVDVLTGFLDDNGEARGRPVGVSSDRTGALLVADDVGNIIWRVSALSPGAPGAAAPAPAPAPRTSPGTR